MRLTPERAGPYLRALAAAVHALAPNDDFVPALPLANHLRALDPALSGTLLTPAELDAQSGLPSFAWFDRARAEQVLARAEPDRDPTPADIQRAHALDADLAERLASRGRLRPFLRANPLTLSSHLHAALIQLQPRTIVRLTYDHHDPVGRLTRLRVELHGSGLRSALGPIRVHPNGAEPDAAAIHLLARHTSTPLPGLVDPLQEVFDAAVVRVARAQIGPFWFQGGPLPSDVPADLGAGLLLHAAVDLMGLRQPAAAHADPWRPPHRLVREHWAGWRERRFAASEAVRRAVEAWCRAQGVAPRLVPIRPGPPAAGRG